MSSAKTNNMRHKARRKVRNSLNGSRYATCYWCGCEIVFVKTVPSYRRISIADGMITYRTNAGSITTKAVASVDHVDPLRNGGDNSPDNLKPSCVRCNNERDKGPRLKFQPRPVYD